MSVCRDACNLDIGGTVWHCEWNLALATARRAQEAIIAFAKDALGMVQDVA